MKCDSASFHPYKINWQETLSTGVSGSVFAITTVILLGLVCTQTPMSTLSYSLIALEATSFVLFAMSFSLLRKKISQMPKEHSFVNLSKDPMPPSIVVKDHEDPPPSIVVKDQKEEKKPIIPEKKPLSSIDLEPEKKAFIDPLTNIEHDSSNKKDSVVEVPVSSNIIETTPFENLILTPFDASKQIETVREELKGFFLSLNDFIASFVQAFYASGKRNTFSASLPSDLKVISENLKLIEHILDEIIQKPQAFFRTALNLLPPSINEALLLEACKKEQDKDFLLSFLNSFTLENQSFDFFLTLLTTNLDQENFIDQSTSSLIKTLRKSFSEKPDAKKKSEDFTDEDQIKCTAFIQASYQLLDHLFLKSKVEEDILKQWMHALCIPVLSLIKINPEQINKAIAQLKIEFSDKGRANNEFLRQKIAKRVGGNRILVFTMLKGLSTKWGIQEAYDRCVKPTLNDMFNLIYLPHRQDDFRKAVLDLAYVLVQPVIFGFFTDNDPLRLGIKKIAESLKDKSENNNSSQSNQNIEIEKAFAEAKLFLKTFIDKLNLEFLKKS